MIEYMSYRNYLYKIEKTKQIPDGDIINVIESNGVIQLIELGDYSFDYKDISIIDISRDSDSELLIVDKMFLEKLIESMRLDILDSYNSQITKINSDVFYAKQLFTSRTMSWDWEIDFNSNYLLSDGILEHEIFNLFYIYKTFDFDKYNLLYIGY